MNKIFRVLALFNPDDVLDKQALESYVGREADIWYSTIKNTYWIGWFFEHDELSKALGIFAILAGFNDDALHELTLKEAIKPLLELVE